MRAKLFIANIVLSLLLLTIVILSFSGNIHFGNGYGDILSAGIAVLAFLIHLIFTLSFHFSKKADVTEYRKLLFIFCCVLILLIYKFTIGRGPESPWNGSVFV